MAPGLESLRNSLFFGRLTIWRRKRLELMEKGNVLVKNGQVTSVRWGAEGTEQATFDGDSLGGDALLEILKILKQAGWEPDGELPLHISTGTYSIPLVKVK
jgi:hypothetical protein